MYVAKIIECKKDFDAIIYKVEFTNGEETETKDYRFVMVADIETSLDDTIKTELKRMNDLEMMYNAISSKVGATYYGD